MNTKVFTHLPVNLPAISDTTAANGVRYYEVPGGKKYPSVTTVLAEHSRDGITQWTRKVGKSVAAHISQMGRDRGERFHGITEAYLQNKGYPKPKSYLEIDAFQSVIPVLNRIDNIRVQEQGLFSHNLRMAGRCDLIADFDEIPNIIDFKTARKPKQPQYIHSYFMQATAYSIMFEELTGIVIKDLAIIIAVDGQGPQVFQEKRKNWVKELVRYRDIYESKNPVA